VAENTKEKMSELLRDMTAILPLHESIPTRLHPFSS
jgi:hypothetical protein